MAWQKVVGVVAVLVDVLTKKEKAMPRKSKELTRMPLKKGLDPKWRRIYKGQIHYFRGTYDDALAQWEKKKIELDKETDENAHLIPYEKLRSCMKSWGAAHIAYFFDNMIAKHPPLLDWIVEWVVKSIFNDLSQVHFVEENPHFEPFLVVEKDDDYFRIFHPVEIDDTIKTYFLSDDVALDFFNELCEDVEHKFKEDYREGTQQTTIALSIEQFLDRQKAKVSGGLRSSGRYELLKRCLSHFREFIGGRAGTDRLNAVFLESYHSKLLGEMKNGWTPDYAVLYMGAAKQFIRWAWRKELIPNLPRNIDDSDLAIATTPKKLKTFSKEEIHILFSFATERTKLYLLLMLNAGMTQKDIADLTRQEVNFEHGWIERKRSKTKNHGNVPTIRYTLWNTTLELLRKHQSKDPVLVLVNEDGKPLKVDELREDKGVSIDNIATAYKRLIKRVKDSGTKIDKTLKHFRKTSSGKLEDSDFSQCSRWFLGHAPRSVADIHYLPPPQKTFDRAIKWLAKEYGID